MGNCRPCKADSPVRIRYPPPRVLQRRSLQSVVVGKRVLQPSSRVLNSANRVVTSEVRDRLRRLALDRIDQGRMPSKGLKGYYDNLKEALTYTRKKYGKDFTKRFYATVGKLVDPAE